MRDKEQLLTGMPRTVGFSCDMMSDQKTTGEKKEWRCVKRPNSSDGGWREMEGVARYKSARTLGGEGKISQWTWKSPPFERIFPVPCRASAQTSPVSPTATQFWTGGPWLRPLLGWAASASNFFSKWALLAKPARPGRSTHAGRR